MAGPEVTCTGGGAVCRGAAPSGATGPDVAAAAAAAVALLGVDDVPPATAAAEGAAGAVTVAMLLAEVLDPGPEGGALDGAAAPTDGPAEEVFRRLAQEPPGLGPEDACVAALVGEGDGWGVDSEGVGPPSGADTGRGELAEYVDGPPA